MHVGYCLISDVMCVKDETEIPQVAGKRKVTGFFRERIRELEAGQRRH